MFFLLRKSVFQLVQLFIYKETIESKMLEYKRTLAEKLGKDVVRTQIIALLNSIYGVFKIDLKMNNDIEIKEYQWSDLQQWNISFGGYADE